METKGPKTETVRASTTEPQHDRTENQIDRPPPRSPEDLKKEEGGGETPPTATPTQPQATGSPTRGWRETD